MGLITKPEPHEGGLVTLWWLVTMMLNSFCRKIMLFTVTLMFVISKVNLKMSKKEKEQNDQKRKEKKTRKLEEKKTKTIVNHL